MALLSPKELAGVYERLKRADESIRYLNGEIALFLKPPAGGFSKDRVKAANEFREHCARDIPLRFGVLAGEIVHHLRSSLDNLAWSLSSESYRNSARGRDIEFPICLDLSNKEKRRSYDRKVKGITATAAVDLIKQLQPCNAPDPLDDPLAIVHDLDCIDKHHTLLLVVGVWQMTSFQFPQRFQSYIISGFEVNQPPPVQDKLKMQFAQNIAFDKFGKRQRSACHSIAHAALERNRQHYSEIFGVVIRAHTTRPGIVLD